MGKNELKIAALGIRECVLISVGGMVGIAVFVLSSLTVVLTGPAAVLAWAVAGLLMFIIALNFAELVTAFPKAGGIYVYPYETFKGKTPKIFFSFLTGWLYWFTFGVLAQIVGAIYIARLMTVFIPGIENYSIQIAILFLIFVWLLNFLGIVIAGLTNTILTFTLLTLIAGYIAVGIPNVNLTYYTPLVSGFMGLKGFLVSITIAWLGYTAWIAITSVAEEVREPQKTIPKALAISLPICIIFYFLILFTTFGSAPWTEFTEEKNPFAYYAPLLYATTKFGAPWLTPIISVAQILAIITTMLVLFLDSSRVLFAMGRTGMLPRVFTYTHKRFKTPVVSLTLLLIVSAVMVTQPQLIQFLIQMGGGSFGIICIICSFSLIFLRHYRKDVKPSFKVPGGLAIPILAIAIILLAMTQYEGIVYYLTAGWIGCGCIYYLARYLTKTGIFSQKVTG